MVRRSVPASIRSVAKRQEPITEGQTAFWGGNFGGVAAGGVLLFRKLGASWHMPSAPQSGEHRERTRRAESGWGSRKSRTKVNAGRGQAVV
jgi:hypothetical protein